MNNNKALAALICGICGLFIPLVPIAAIILGILGMKESKKTNDGYGFSVTGLVLGIVGIITGFLLILPFIGALAYFGAISPDNMLPERTSFQAPIPNIDNANIQSDGSVSIPFRNNQGMELSLTGEVSGTEDCTNAQLVSTSMNNQIIPLGTSISNGESFTIVFGCDQMKSGERFRTDVSFDYQLESGPVRTHYGSIYGKVS